MFTYVVLMRGYELSKVIFFAISYACTAHWTHIFDFYIVE